jgi:hypothetical protein
VKALTLWRPWPWAIFHARHNPKRIENRPWVPPTWVLNEVIALHAGAVLDGHALHFIAEASGDSGVYRAIHPGGIIGVATVRGYVDQAEAAEHFMVGQSAWFSGPFAWLLSDVRTLTKPVPCKGFQKLWNLPPEVERQVLAQL